MIFPFQDRKLEIDTMMSQEVLLRLFDGGVSPSFQILTLISGTYLIKNKRQKLWTKNLLVVNFGSKEIYSDRSMR